jgi:hypothetical protein
MKLSSRSIRTVIPMMGAALFAAALVLMWRYGTSRPGVEAHAVNITYADGYDLDRSPTSAVSFPGNSIVVIGDVVEALPPQWNTSAPGRETLSFIFTPMRVAVREVLRGSPRLDNGAMIVRKLGGRVGDEELVVSTSIDAANLAVGQRVLLFMGPQRVLNSLDAATPNMVFLVDSRGVATSVDGRWSLDTSWFRDQLR